MFWIWFLLINFWLTVLGYEPLNIVIHSSVGGKSHIKGMLEIMQVLSERHHHITYVALEDYLVFAKDYNISTYSLGPPLLDPKAYRNNFKQDLLGKRSSDTMSSLTQIVRKFYSDSYEKEFPALNKYLAVFKPDLLICDTVAMACLDLAKIHGIPLIVGVQTIDSYRMKSNSHITRMAGFGPLTTENLSLFQRIKTMILDHFWNERRLWKMMEPVNELRQQHGFSPALRVFDLKYGLGIANTFLGFETPTAVIPSLKLVGPILSKSQPLTADFKNFLDTHPRTLYIAFGTLLVLDSTDISLILESVLFGLNNDIIDGVIWGLSKITSQDLPESITFNNTLIKTKTLWNNPQFYLSSWAPQQAILDHKNTKLFLSHGGLESLMETIQSATPVLCMSFISDQPRNAAKIEAAGIGRYINRMSATPSSLTQQITEILTDSNGYYRTNLKRMQIISKLSSQVNYAADLIESHGYIAKNCRPLQPYKLHQILPPCELQHLVPATTRMSFIHTHLVDVYSIVITTIILFFVITIYSIYYYSFSATNLKHKHD